MSRKSQAPVESDVDAVLRDAGVLPTAATPSRKTAKLQKSATPQRRGGQKAASRKPATQALRAKENENENGKAVRLKLADIIRDPALRMRNQLNKKAVRRYQMKYERERDGLLQQGEHPFPPCDVFRLPSGEYTLANGWHRCEAMGAAGILEWSFNVRAGSKEDAAQFAAAANQGNDAVRVTNADKQKTVMNLLLVCAHLSDRELGERAGVDHKTVAKYRSPAHADRSGARRNNSKGAPRAKPAVAGERASGGGEIPQAGKATPGSNGRSVNGASAPRTPAIDGSRPQHVSAGPAQGTPAAATTSPSNGGDVSAEAEGTPAAAASGTTDVEKEGATAPVESGPGVAPVEVTVGVESSWVAVRLGSMSITVRVVEVSERDGVQVARIQVWEGLVTGSTVNSTSGLQ